MRWVLPCFAWQSIALGGLLAPVGLADDFRIETEIFIGNEEKPAVENLTLFYDGRVYDFLLTEPAEITVFDNGRAGTSPGQFILLDPARKIQTRIDTETVMTFNSEIRSKAASAGPVVQFAAQPKFDERFDAAQSRLTLASSVMSYTVEGIELEDADVRRQYYEFADWYARLNATRPGSLPPFARLQVNKALSVKGLVPTRVERTILFKGKIAKKTSKVHSRHEVALRLVRSDRKKIDTAGKYVVQFEKVSFDQYRRLSIDIGAKQDRRR